MAIDTVKLIETPAENRGVAPFKRASESGVRLMRNARLRFFDAHGVRSFEANADSIHGELPSCKTKKPSGPDWIWARPLIGMAGSSDWARPLVDYRGARDKTNGVEPTFTFPRVNHLWGLDIAEHFPYPADRR